MRLLVVYPYIPWPLNRGAYHRAFHLLRGLARNHEIDLLALAENGEGMEFKEVFQEFCHRVEFLPFQHPAWEKLIPNRLFNPLPSTIAHWTLPVLREGIRNLVNGTRYDAVHVEDIVVAQDFLKEHKSLPLVVDRTRVDLQYQLMEHKRLNFSLKNRILNYENYSKLWLYEKAVARRSALQVLCGPDDEDFVRSYISRTVPVKVIPNGVDLDYFRPESSDGPREKVPTVIFCGAMDYNPNVDALRWYFGEMHEALRARIPELQVMIVGKDPVAEVQAYGRRPGVVVTGGVPDVRPFYKRAWLQIVPLRIGGGTRLKIVESLGIGTPVISTTIGAQGLFLKHNEEILLADTAETFIAEAARALQDQQLRTRLAERGLSTARERLSWKQLGQQLSDAYLEHVHSPARARLAAKPHFTTAAV